MPFLVAQAERDGRCCGAVERQRQPAVAAVALGEGGQRVGEVVAVEVGPQPLGEVELGVGAFPQQEVRQPLLAAGADQQVDVEWRVTAGEQPSDTLARQVGGLRCRDGIDEFVTSGIVNGDAHVQAITRRSRSFRSLDCRRDAARQSITPADHGEARAGRDELADLGVEVVTEQAHQQPDLGRRPPPVVGGEGVDASAS